MRLKQLICNIEPVNFFRDIVLSRKILFFKSQLSNEVLPSRDQIEQFVKDPQNFKCLRLALLDKGHSPIVDEEGREYFYQKIRELTGDQIWDFISRKEGAVHITNLLHSFSSLKQLSLDFFKYTPFGCQTYLVISKGLVKSPYDHHADSMDLFAIQIAGVKRWKIAIDNNGMPYFKINKALPYNPNDQSQKYLEFELRTGDVLFLPFQTPHYVEQIGEELSIHLVIGLTRNFKSQGSNFLRNFLLKKVIDNERPFELRDDQMLYLADFQSFKDQLLNFAHEFDPETAHKEFLKSLKSYDILRTHKG
jgi:ribosomal protein L16 Arg81 hydroxylase